MSLKYLVVLLIPLVYYFLLLKENHCPTFHPITGTEKKHKKNYFNTQLKIKQYYVKCIEHYRSTFVSVIFWKSIKKFSKIKLKNMLCKHFYLYQYRNETVRICFIPWSIFFQSVMLRNQQTILCRISHEFSPPGFLLLLVLMVYF